MIGHVSRIVRPDSYLHPFAQQHSLEVATYALHVSEAGIDFPPEWVLQKASVIDAEDVDWPMIADKNLENVWCCTVIGKVRDTPELRLEFRDRWNVRLTDAQREELKVDQDVLEKAEFDQRLCQLTAQNQNLRFFGRLFIEPAPEQSFMCERKIPTSSDLVSSWQLELGPPTPAMEIALNTRRLV